MNTILSDFLTAVLPAVVQLIGAVLGILLIRASNTARARWGIEIEARHREALHSALMSGVRAAMGRGLMGQTVIAAAIEHAGRSVPDALAALQPTPDVLSSIAQSKLREVVDATHPVKTGMTR